MDVKKEEKDIESVVTKNVYMGDGKFREFRLPKSQVTERSQLWPAKQEVGQRIAQIMKEKREQIAEMKKWIKQMEQCHTNWAAVAKAVNVDSENFLLDAIFATDEDIKEFERHNFLSNAGWTKLRDVAELTKEEKDKMCAATVDESERDYCVLQADHIEKLNHYEWICSKSEGLSSLEKECVGDPNRKDIPSKLEKPTEDNIVINSKDNVINEKEAIIQDFESEEEKEEQEYCREVATSPMFLVMSDDVAQNDFSPVENQQTETKTPNVEDLSNGTTEPESNVSTEKKISAVADISRVTRDTDPAITVAKKFPNGSTDVELRTEHPELSTNGETSIGSKDVKQYTLTKVKPPSAHVPNDTSVRQNGTSSSKATKEKVEPDNAKLDTLKVENNVENGHSINNSTSCSPTATKKPLADLSGYSRLRLTSSSSSTDIPPTQPPTPKVTHGSIWEQKAAEREEQLMAEKKIKENQTAKPASASSVPTKPTGNKAPVKPAREQPQNGNASKATPHKLAEPNEWITFASKKTVKPKNGNFLKDLEKQESAPSATENTEKSNSGTLSSPLVEPSNVDVEKMSSKPEKEASSRNAINEKETSESKSDEAEAEKRAKRRQRKKEQAKLNAEQKQEEERRIREQKRVEREQRIEAEKKEKELKRKQEYEQRQRDNEEIRRQYKEMRPKNKPKPIKTTIEAERLQRAMKIKERLEAYVNSTDLTYRLIAAKLYIDCRMKQISEEKKDMDINKQKIGILEKNLGRIAQLETISKFMVFISFQLGDDRNKFKIEHLLDCIPNLRRSSGQLSAEFLAVHEAYDAFVDTIEGKLHETIDKAAYFVTEVLAKMSTMKYKDEVKVRTQGVLENFRSLHEETVHFVDIAAYLRTREKTEFFIVEEDYLLTAADSENCGLQKSSEGDSVQKTDSCCQTEKDCNDKLCNK